VFTRLRKLLFGSYFEPKPSSSINSFFPDKNKKKPVNYKISQAVNECAQSALKSSSSVKQAVVNKLPALIEKKRLRRQERRLYISFVKGIHGGFKNTPAKDITAVVNRCLHLVKKNKIGKKERAEIRDLFAEFAKLPEDQFDAQLLLANEEKIQRLLSPKLDVLMRAQERVPKLKENKEHQLRIDIARAELAIKMGVKPAQAGGQNGAQLIKSLEGKNIGIFKASSDKLDLMRILKNYVGQARLFDRSNPLNESRAERVVYLFNEAFGLNLIPTAQMISFNGQKGAFISFLREHQPGLEYQPLKNVMAKFNKRPKGSYSKEELIIWQKLTLFIGMTLNMDPHDENIFVCIDENGKLIDAKIIDGGNCFPQFLPGKWGSKGHRADPGMHPISEAEFLPEVMEFIKSDLMQDKFDHFVSQVKQEMPDFWSDQVDELHRMVFRKLKNGIVNGTVKTPENMLNIMTKADFSLISSVCQENNTSLSMDDFFQMPIEAN